MAYWRISAFWSVYSRHIELVIIMPHKDRRIKGLSIVFVIGSRMMEICIILYPPSFSKVAARIIDPEMGASPWALGSHRWTPYIGILNKKCYYAC